MLQNDYKLGARRVLVYQTAAGWFWQCSSWDYQQHGPYLTEQAALNNASLTLEN